MKAKKALGMALALASALFIAACSNLDSGSVDNGAASVYSANRALYISVNNVDLSDGSGAAVYDPWIQKTVLPKEAYTTAQLTLVLKAISNGKTVTYHILGAGAPNALDATKTDYSLNLPAANYDFWLYAYKTADITAASMATADGEAIVNASDIAGATTLTTAFWAHGAQDLTNGAASISFTLSPVDLTGNGKIQLGGAYVDPDGVVKGIIIGIYNVYTNELITTGSPAVAAEKRIAIATPARTTVAAPSYFGSASNPAGSDIANKGTTGIVPEAGAQIFTVPAGSYRAAVTFYADTTYTSEVGYWSDIVVVEPTNISDNRDIFFQGINTKPKAPTGLTASLVENSYKKNGQVNGKYDIELDWTDNASNEKGFLVRVTKYTINFGSSTENAGTPEVYGFAAAAGNVGGDTVLALASSDYFTQKATPETNLLLSQCENVTLTLETGYLYDFEVVAYNSIGYSEYVPGLGGATPDTTDAVADGFSATSTDPLYYATFVKSGGWTPRKPEAGETAFATGKMKYKMDAVKAAVAAAYTEVDKNTVTEPVKGTPYFTSPSTGVYNIAYVSKWDAATTYYTLDANTGTPYTTYRVNLSSLEYNLAGGQYYDTGISIGSLYAFFRFGNDEPNFNTFGAIAANDLNGTTPLTNPVTKTDITPTSKGSETTPFIIKWNTSGKAYSNWQAWYRQSQTSSGTTTYYNTTPVAANVLLYGDDAGWYANQVVYAAYAGNSSDLTIVVGIDTAADGVYDFKDAYITAEAVAARGDTTGDTLAVTQDATNVVTVGSGAGQYNYLYLNVDTSSASPAFTYSAVKYVVGKVQQYDVSSTGCYVDLTDPDLANNITVQFWGLYKGVWYGRSFSVELRQ